LFSGSLHPFLYPQSYVNFAGYMQKAHTESYQ
jgi:hypothetical protein